MVKGQISGTRFRLWRSSLWPCIHSLGVLSRTSENRIISLFNDMLIILQMTLERCGRISSMDLSRGIGFFDGQ